ncbi:MAG: hypothetical protein MN733_00895 [Nitrososphaera sp.]|nr:hypothetical protein [Nitrososphaera sp.]
MSIGEAGVARSYLLTMEDLTLKMCKAYNVCERPDADNNPEFPVVETFPVNGTPQISKGSRFPIQRLSSR